MMIDNAKSISDKLIQRIDDTFVSTSNTIGGWHHYHTPNKVSALGTGIGLGCLSYSRKRDRRMELSINLLSRDINDDGGYGIKIINDSNISLTESTSYILYSLILLRRNCPLNEIEKNKIKSLIEKSTNWLILNKNPNDGWGPLKGYESHTFSTAIAILSLSAALEQNEMDFEPNKDIGKAIFEGQMWLVKARNHDSGWGANYQDQKSTPFHTSMTVYALNRSKFVDIELFNHAKNWLFSNWNKKTYWEKSIESTNLIETYDINLEENKWARAIWHHFPTCWAIIALGSLDGQCKTSEFYQSMKWLLNECKDGCVRRPTDSSPPIWAIFDTLIAMDNFINLYQNNLVTMPLRKMKIMLELKEIILLIKRFFVWIILVVYMSVGLICVYASWISLETYILGLILPISLLLIDKYIDLKI